MKVKLEMEIGRANLMHQLVLTGINELAAGCTEIRTALADAIAKAQKKQDNVTSIRKRKDAPKTS